MKIKFCLITVILLIVKVSVDAQFAASASDWQTPQGGTISNNNLLGYNYVAGEAAGLTNTSQTWSLVDINGDGKPDLVVTAAQQAQGPTQLSASSNPYWQVYLNTGSGFSTTATNWTTPQGGNITNNNLLGYNDVAGVASSGQTNSSQTWSLADMNGDGKPDLVVTAAQQSQGPTQFSASSNPYWQVFLNTGSGFSTTATNWTTPQGGNITNNNLLGYNNVSGIASSGQTNSSQTWSLADMNGDGKPDLVVTAAQQSQGPTQFSASSNPYWQVFLNTGSGFSTTATNWATPQGGNITNNNLLGYNDVVGVASSGQTNTSQTWSMVDINGDSKPDLVVTAAEQAQGPTQFSASGNPYWQVFLNTGSGFSTTASNWTTPQGGNITSNNLLGYNNVAGAAAGGQTNSSQTWALADMNNDGKPDLVVTAALQSQGPTQFSASSNPYWQVYQNNGSGFSTSANNWSTPQGGNITSNNLLGYNALSGVAAAGQTNTSQSWTVTDINGDGTPDLIVTAALQSQGATEFSATSNPYWQVYLNLNASNPIPTITTNAATNVITSYAQLNAVVNPNGTTATGIQFEWGTTTGYGNTAAASPGSASGTGSTNVSASLTGLQSNTTYYFQAMATDGGTILGGQQQFTTGGGSGSATITSLPATGIATNGAQLNATVTPNSTSVTAIQFEWGTATSYGNTTAATPGSVNSGSGSTAVSAVLTGLQSNTTYYYQVGATVSGNQILGGQQQFYTSTTGIPVVSISNARIYPNPARHRFSVETHSSETYTLYMYNMMGEKVAERIISQPLTTVDVSLLAGGIYTVSLVKDEAVKSFRLVVMNE